MVRRIRRASALLLAAAMAIGHRSGDRPGGSPPGQHAGGGSDRHCEAQEVVAGQEAQATQGQGRRDVVQGRQAEAEEEEARHGGRAALHPSRRGHCGYVLQDHHHREGPQGREGQQDGSSSTRRLIPGPGRVFRLASPRPPPARSCGSTRMPTATAAMRRPAARHGLPTAPRSRSTPRRRTSCPASTTAALTCISRRLPPGRSALWTLQRTAR